LTNDPLYREHVTLYIYENPALFKIKNVSDGGRDHSYINCSIDTPKDLDKVRDFVSANNGDFGYTDVIRYFGGY
jgi:spore coat polysaccharide biosynthesis protein SpsF (cytidylyltransferase family)